MKKYCCQNIKLRFIISGFLIIFISYYVWWPKYYGLSFIALGVVCNALAVFLNVGKMPVANFPDEMLPYKQLGDNTRVKFLCDIFNIGRASFSIGDVLAVIGLILFIVL